MPAALVAVQDAVFRASVDLVTVDAAVIGRDGRPIPDLRPEDFVLEVDGRSRQVVSAQFIVQAAPGTRPAPLRASHFTSNEHLDTGRIVVIAVDEAHIRRLEGRPALQAAGRFIDTLDPLDLVGVVGLSRVGVVELTRNHAGVKRNLDTLLGHTDPVFLQFNIGLLEAVEVADGSPSRLADMVLRECGLSRAEYLNPNRLSDEGAGRDPCPEQVEQEARAVAQHARTQARISLSALSALVDALKALDGPKTIVLLSEGMVVDPRLVDLGQLAAATRDARVTIYGLHMETPVFEAAQDRISPTLMRDVQLRGDGLSRLAGAARGTVFRLVGSDPRPFARIAQELSGYYLLAFEPTAADRDGRTRRIKVSLARGGAEIRARETFRLPTVVRSARAREEELVLLLRGLHPATELPVRVATYTYAEPGSDQLRVVVSTEADAAPGPASDVLLGYVLIASDGVIAASGAQRAGGGRHAFSTVIAPGSYTLRVGGIDGLDRRGLAERPFAAALADHAGVRMSDLILAPVPPTSGAPLQPFVDRVHDARVTAYVEIHARDAQPLADAQVTFEIMVEGSDEPRIAVDAALVRHNQEWGLARAVLALDQLPTGRYLARARMHAAGREVASVARPFTLAGSGSR
jgi:VWFA-related protein